MIPFVGSQPEPPDGQATIVRRARPDDAASLCDVYLRAWRAGYDGLVEPDRLEPIARRRRAHDWSAAVQADHTAFGLCIVDGDPAGLVKIGTDSTEAVPGTWLSLLYVVPERWGTGLAHELLAWALRQPEGARHPVVRLRVVEAQRRARRFYERHGWTYDEQVPPSSNELFSLLCMRLEPTWATGSRRRR